jgi:hypothetical protein
VTIDIVITEEESGTPFWDDSPDEWDFITINGVTLPLASDPDGEIGRKLDVKYRAGADGGTITDKGLEACKIKIGVLLWTRDHLRAWDALLPVLGPRKRLRDRAPLAVYHPVLEQIEVRRIYVESVSALKRGSTIGTREATITAHEYAPPSTRRGGNTRRIQGDFVRDTAFTPTFNDARTAVAVSQRDLSFGIGDSDVDAQNAAAPPSRSGATRP